MSPSGRGPDRALGWRSTRGPRVGGLRLTYGSDPLQLRIHRLRPLAISVSADRKNDVERVVSSDAFVVICSLRRVQLRWGWSVS